MRALAVAVFVAGSCLPPLVPAAASQSVLVEVTAAESARPLTGVFVSLLDDEGRVLQSALTNESGRFVFPVARPGTFQVKAELIGRETEVSAPFTLGVGDSGRIPLALSSHAIPLAEIHVEVEGRCHLRPDDATELARVWDEARKAITVQAWSEREGLHRLELSTYERDLDAAGRRVEREDRREASRVTRIPFASLPPEDLVRGGFVRRLDDGGFQYYGPDARLLLSDVFMDTHCFRLTRSAEHPGALGLAFEPVGAGERPDIRGTLWLDEVSAALRAIEYRYTRARYAEAEGIAGGRVEFLALPDGTWMIERWRIRAPLLARRQDLARAGDSGIRVIGIRETGGEVVEVVGVSSSDQETLVRAERGSVHGAVWDSTASAPLAGALVQLAGTRYRAETDDEGRFVLDALPPGLFTAVFTHPRLDALGVAVPGVEADVVAGRTSELTLAIPSRTTILRRVLDLEIDPPPGLFSGGALRATGEVGGVQGIQGVQGTLVELESGRPVGSAEVTLRSGSGEILARELTDERGFFRLRIPRSGRFLLSARALGYGELTDEVVEVVPEKLTVLEVRLVTEAFELEPIVVTVDARSFHLEMEGFYRRDREGFGVFLTPELLDERRPHKVTNLFFGLPGVRVIEPSGGAGGRAVYLRGGDRGDRICWPMVYVDRHLVSTGGLAGAEPTAIDDVVFAPDILAIEIYRSPAEIPSEFHGPNAGCGVVVLWTRRGGGG